MAVVEISLDRVRELRDARDTVSSSQGGGAKQGVLSGQWQRPICGELSSRRSLPVVDTLLAATALAHDLAPVTRNVRDVAATGVQVINPWRPA